jgi:hypothetical protein
MSDTTRRAVLAGAAGVTAVTVLAACGDGSDSGSTANSGSTAGAGGVLATKADIPLGGGKIFTDGGGVVVTARIRTAWWPR